MELIFDAHLDLAMNAIEWNRDLTRPLEEIRRRESGLTDKKDRGQGVVCLPEMRRGGIGLCVATQIARVVEPDSQLPGWHSPAIAWAMTQAQLAWYREAERQGWLCEITNLEGLDEHLRAWEAQPERAPIGYVRSLEGADSLVTLRHLESAYADGLRVVGPAHYGPGRYSPGTGLSGGLEPAGRDLLREMDRLGMILDVTHLTDEAMREALDLFTGPVWASHSNCRSLVPDQRQLSDEQIQVLVERGAVIGAAMDAWMLIPHWRRGETTPEQTGVCLAHVVDQIDYVCNLVGDARHVGIGSDLDGAFGREQAPLDVTSIADLGEIRTQLRERGYSDEDVSAIMHGNWIRRLRESWGG